jgi:hypothetical protein
MALQFQGYNDFHNHNNNINFEKNGVHKDNVFSTIIHFLKEIPSFRYSTLTLAGTYALYFA